MRKVRHSSHVTERSVPVEASHAHVQPFVHRTGTPAPSEVARGNSQAVDSFAPAFLRTRDVLRITSLSRATLYRRIAVRRFPAPVHLGGRACGWPTAAIQDWIRDPEGYRAPDADDVGRSRVRRHG